MIDWLAVETKLERIFERVLSKVLPDNAVNQDVAPKWLSAKEASDYIGFSKSRLIELGHAGEIIMDRKNPTNNKSDFLFFKPSLDAFSNSKADRVKAEKDLVIKI